jgi:hypothetical protein
MGTGQKTILFLAAASAVALMPRTTFAARQKAMGLTSGAITATNPTQHQMQLIFDPGALSLNVQAFQLGVQYDSSVLDIVPGSFMNVNPFQLDTQKGPIITPNLIDHISGSALRTATVPGDVNLFTITFQLKSDAKIDTPLRFKFGGFDATDFIRGVDTTDPNNPNNDVTFFTKDIVPTNIQGTVVQNYATYRGDSGNWSNPATWALNIVPASNSFVSLSGDAGQVQVYLDDNAKADGLASLTLDASFGRSVTLRQDLNTLGVNGTETIGDYGSGKVLMNNGFHSATNMILGNLDSALGQFDLGGGSLTVHGDEFVGFSGQGVFTQHGGSHVIGGTLHIAGNAGSKGEFDLQAGTLRAAATVNNDTFNQTGGVASLGSLSGGGSLTVAGNNTALTVTNFAQGNVMINPGGRVTVPSAAVRYTNTATNLSINGGTLDLNNHNLLTTNTSAATIRQYLINGYNADSSGNAHWNGTGGIVSTLAADASALNVNNPKFTIGYATAADNATTALGLTGNQVLVMPTIPGDATMDGLVDIGDLNVVLSNYLSGKAPRWGNGDFTYAGHTDITALNFVLSNYLQKSPYPSAVPVAHAAATGHSVVVASSEPAFSGLRAVPANTLQLIVDPTSGDVKLEGSDVKIASIQITSGGSLRAGNWKSLGSQNVAGWNDSLQGTPGALAEYDYGFASSHDSATVDGVIDYGNIFLAGAPQDLIFQYGVVNPDGVTLSTVSGVVSYAVPEPASLSLLALGAMGLFARRRGGNVGYSSKASE